MQIHFENCGAYDETFVKDMLVIVQTTCKVEDMDMIDHSVKINGKWTSVTVQAPIASTEMLYQLYKNVDQDSRVRFKF
jgi:putative lipoic acid-binding regulatory protein